jgi:hypothetical protein
MVLADAGNSRHSQPSLGTTVMSKAGPVHHRESLMNEGLVSERVSSCRMSPLLANDDTPDVWLMAGALHKF